MCFWPIIGLISTYTVSVSSLDLPASMHLLLPNHSHLLISFFPSNKTNQPWILSIETHMAAVDIINIFLIGSSKTRLKWQTHPSPIIWIGYDINQSVQYIFNSVARGNNRKTSESIAKFRHQGLGNPSPRSCMGSVSGKPMCQLASLVEYAFKFLN